MVGMCSRKEQERHYRFCDGRFRSEKRASQRSAVGHSVKTSELTMTVPMLHNQEQPLSKAPRALLMTPEQCAEFLGIKINTLYVMKSQGRIPYRKVGHLLRFDFDEIVEWTKDKEK